MRRARQPILTVLLIAGAVAAAPTPAVASTPPDIARLLGQLADSDPAVRVRAYRRLSDAGSDARPRLLAALIADLSDPDPDVRSSAALRLADMGAAAQPALAAAENQTGSLHARLALARSMLQGPWARPGDPTAVALLLRGYGQANVPTRQAIVRELADLPDGQGQLALLRILQKDPVTAVRWGAATALRMAVSGGDMPLSRLRALLEPARLELALATRSNSGAPPATPRNPPPSPPNPPLLAIVGWAWRVSDPAWAADLLRRSVDLDAASPAALSGELDFAYLWLVERATAAQDFTAAAALLRRQAARAWPEQPWTQDIPATPLAQLLALHATHGPLPGLRGDLWTFRAQLADPAALYALAELQDRDDHPLIAAALRAGALAWGGLSTESHTSVGSFLADEGWVEPAERELNLALALSALARPPGQPTVDDEGSANIYFQLARAAGSADDELGEAHALEHAIRALHGRPVWRTTPSGDTVLWPTADAWAEVHWHYLRAARDAGDLTAMRDQLQQLLELDKLNQVLGDDPSLATDVVPALQETGHAAQARQCFDAAYAALRAALAAKPNDPDAKNDLAWLCARCGQHLPEALQLADAAVAASPATAAYLDTDAEAHFRLRQFADAVRLESRALQLTPADRFMQRQLARFQAAAAPPAAAPSR